VTEATHRLPPGRSLTILLALFTTIGPYTIDAFFPSLRAMALHFGISNFQVQQTLTAYMVPFALAALLHGSISDAVGRRRVMIGGLSLYAVASLGCALAPGFGTLLFMRACQGLVSGVGMIIARAIIRDLYSGPLAQRAMSTMTMFFALGPAMAPVAGGWLHVWFGWRAVFLSMVLLGVGLVLAAWRWLPETLPPEQRSELHVGTIFRRLLEVMRHVEFLRLTAVGALFFVAMQAYIGAAPAIILDHWHGSETGFAMLTLPLIGGFVSGAFTSGRLAGRIPPDRQENIGHGLMLASTACLFALQLAWPGVPVLLQQLLLAGMTFGLQIVYPVLMLKIIDLFPQARGTATSANSFLGMAASTLTMGTFAPWLGHSMLRLATCSFLAILAGWFVSLWVRHARRVLAAG
jgi:DHA1 family bicyclomycin/chloramphenicol resistance-like MFS transporter